MLRSASLVAILALSVLLPSETRANAGSSTTDRIIRDCESSPTGALRGTYGLRDLRTAANELPGDVVEYSGCPDAIQQAIDAIALRHAHGVDGGGLRLHHAARGSGRDRHMSSPDAGPAAGRNPSATPPSGVQISTVRPAAPGSAGRLANSLPRPLLLLLALLVLVAIVGVGVGRKSRIGRKRP
jgi:hypothetical protein